MPDITAAEIDELIRFLWGELLAERSYHSAALVSVLGYFVARELGSKELREESTSLLLKTVDELKRFSEAKPSTCSFCGKGEPAVQLIAGMNAFICNECVALSTETLEREQSQKTLPAEPADNAE